MRVLNLAFFTVKRFLVLVFLIVVSFKSFGQFDTEFYMAPSRFPCDASNNGPTYLVSSTRYESSYCYGNYF